MIKKYIFLCTLIFSSTQTFCSDNSWYSTVSKYVTLKNSFGVGSLFFGGFALKKTLDSYHLQKHFSKNIEEKNKQKTFKDPGGFNLVQDKDKLNDPMVVFTSKFLTFKTWAWGGISLASFATSVYCLKNNFY